MNLAFDHVMIFVGLFLSLCVFSLLMGDNWLLRFASSILSGVLAAYFCVFLVEKLFYPRIIAGLTDQGNSIENKIVLVLVVLAAALLFLKLYAGKARGGNVVMLVLMCTAAAVMILGSVNGTLIGFFKGLVGKFDLSELTDAESGSPWYWLKSISIIIAALSTLLYTQHYTYKPGKKKAETPAKEGFLHAFGEIITGVSLGAILAGCFVASAVVLSGHLSDLVEAIRVLLK